MSGSPDVGAAVALLRTRMRRTPEVAVVLGSGMASLVEAVVDPVRVPFAELPGFPPTGVEGHAGVFLGGDLFGHAALVQAGRYHLYEGHAADTVAAPVRVAAGTGAGTLVLVGAVGGADPSLESGDVVIVEDHINFMFRSPLVGPVRHGEDRFPDMSAPYDTELRERLLEAAAETDIPVREAVYAGVTGPSYETAAEVRMLRTLGADVIGMSTVPEVIVARALGLRCLALSIVTNRATGVGSGPVSHTDVVAAGGRAVGRVTRLLEAFFRSLPPVPQSTGTK